MARETLLPKYPSLQASHLSVTVLEAGERLVNAARPEHSEYVRRFLEHRGVTVRFGARVARVEDKRLHLADGTGLDAFTILWTAGVRPPDVVARLPVQHAPDGRVLVDEFLRARDAMGEPLDDVFVVGDCAAAVAADGKYYPRLSQTAVKMGSHVGDQLTRRARGLPPQPFDFKVPGYIISLGKHSSVVELFGIPFSGKLAWLLWAGAYLVKMVGLRKQIEVGIDHVTHLLFEHDTSQIMNRRQILSDEELNLSLGASPPQGTARPETERVGVRT
jgi:NADH dehydrogenase